MKDAVWGERLIGVGILVCLFIALTACDTAPKVETRIQTINTACQSFKLIQIPKEDIPKISNDLKSQVLAHGRAWKAACG